MISKYGGNYDLVIYINDGQRGRARPFYRTPIRTIHSIRDNEEKEEMVELQHVTQPWIKTIVFKSVYKRAVDAAEGGLVPYAVEIDCDCVECQKGLHSSYTYHLVLANNPGLREKLKEEQRIRDEIGACRARAAGEG